MPTSAQILLLLTTMSRELVWLAVAWHVVLLLALVALVFLRAPPRPLAVVVTFGLALSVAVSSLAYGNPFNGISMAVLAIAMVIAGWRRRRVRTAPVSVAMLLIGIAAIAYGWMYPHFVQDPWVRVAWAAPLGIVPCPTLAMIAGITIVTGGFGSRWLVALLAAWTALYGVVGVFQLGVMLDIGLLVVAVVLGVMARKRCHSVLFHHARSAWAPLTFVG